MTPRQTAILAAIRAFHAARGRMPTIREICGLAGITSTNGATDFLKAIARRGHLRHEGRHWVLAGEPCGACCGTGRKPAAEPVAAPARASDRAANTDRAQLLSEITDEWMPARYLFGVRPTGLYEDLVTEGLIEEAVHRTGRTKVRTVMCRRRAAEAHS